jgi:hypothetical protein
MKVGDLVLLSDRQSKGLIIEISVTSPSTCYSVLVQGIPIWCVPSQISKVIYEGR